MGWMASGSSGMCLLGAIRCPVNASPLEGSLGAVFMGCTSSLGGSLLEAALLAALGQGQLGSPPTGFKGWMAGEEALSFLHSVDTF